MISCWELVFGGWGLVVLWLVVGVYFLQWDKTI